MSRKKCKIYPVAPGMKPLEILTSEREIYLSCKFWKKTRKEAYLSLIYYIPLLDDAGGRSLIFISQKCTKNNVEKLCSQSYELLRSLSPKSTHKACKKLLNAKKKLNDTRLNYPELRKNNKLNTIQDLNNWAKDFVVCSTEIISHNHQQIQKSKLPIWVYEVPQDLKVKVIIDYLKQCLIGSHTVATDNLKNISYYLLLEDIENLLLLNKKTIDLLKTQLTNLSSIYYIQGSDKKEVYLDIVTTIMWLIKQDLLPTIFEEYFEEYKIAVIKSLEDPNFDDWISLPELEEQGISGQKLTAQSISGGIGIYLKHDREILSWRSDLKQKEYSIYSKKNWNGISRLKLKKNDYLGLDSAGSFTVDMLFFNENPRNTFLEGVKDIRKIWHIEIMPTEEACKCNLQPYLKIISDKKAKEILNPKNILFLKSEINKYLESNTVKNLNENQFVENLSKTDHSEQPNSHYKITTEKTNIKIQFQE